VTNAKAIREFARYLAKGDIQQNDGVAPVSAALRRARVVKLKRFEGANSREIKPDEMGEFTKGFYFPGPLRSRGMVAVASSMCRIG